MNKLFNAVSVIFGVVCGIGASVLGEWDKILWSLAVMMTLDYITGIIKAVYTKTISSEIGFKGILRKIIILAVVALANTVQQLTGSAAIREMVIMFYIANEGISILENAAAVSAHMPQGLKDILLQIRGDDDENRD